jgi:preprotein translocase subunit SecA
MLPDLTTALHETRCRTEDRPSKTVGGQVTKLQQEFEAKAQRIHAISQLLKAYCLYEKDVQYVVQRTKSSSSMRIRTIDDRTAMERRLAPGC